MPWIEWVSFFKVNILPLQSLSANDALGLELIRESFIEKQGSWLFTQTAKALSNWNKNPTLSPSCLSQSLWLSREDSAVCLFQQGIRIGGETREGLSSHWGGAERAEIDPLRPPSAWVGPSIRFLSSWSGSVLTDPYPYPDPLPARLCHRCEARDRPTPVSNRIDYKSPVPYTRKISGAKQRRVSLVGFFFNLSVSCKCLPSF